MPTAWLGWAFSPLNSRYKELARDSGEFPDRAPDFRALLHSGYSASVAKAPDTRTRILDVAQKLVLAQGFTSTSIEQIVDASDLTKGGFFYHFKGKSDLA